MTFDLTWFGYGVGFVMVGWVCGTIVSMILSIFKGASRII